MLGVLRCPREQDAERLRDELAEREAWRELGAFAMTKAKATTVGDRRQTTSCPLTHEAPPL